MKPFRLIAPCKDYLWGGTRLRDYGKTSDRDIIAESWELSCHPDGESIIADGDYAGQTLTAFLAEHPEALGTNCDKFDRFPVLVKLIDAREDLSVQVHPDDAYALAKEGEYGKTELWYVVEAAPDAELIYGFQAHLTKDEFRRAIEEHTLLDKVRRVPVQAGDVFFIPAGTLHAIGKGLLIAEIQQNSNTTYRVYDYGRVGADGKPRELHIEKALDVTNLTKAPITKLHEPAVIPFSNTRYQKLKHCRYFSTGKFEIFRSFAFSQNDGSFTHLLMIDGDAELYSEGETLSLHRGDSIFIPAGTPAIDMFSADGCTLLCTEIEP